MLIKIISVLNPSVAMGHYKRSVLLTKILRKNHNVELTVLEKNPYSELLKQYRKNLIKKIPTEETILKNQFVNNLSISNNTLFFLNTFGSLYSTNAELLNINWFLNLNQSFSDTFHLKLDTNFIFVSFAKKRCKKNFNIKLQSKIPKIISKIIMNRG